MSGGTLNHIINLLRSSEQRTQPLVYGDFPFLHEEMRSAARSGRAWGGEATTERSEQPTGTTGEIAPHASVNNR
jgi:hypothetical protein